MYTWGKNGRVGSAQDFKIRDLGFESHVRIYLTSTKWIISENWLRIKY